MTDNPFWGNWYALRVDDEAYSKMDWDPDIVFDDENRGRFTLLGCRGVMDCRVGTRDGLPCVEWTWSGSEDVVDVNGTSLHKRNSKIPVTGRGFAIWNGERIHGTLFCHTGNDIRFVAARSLLQRVVNNTAGSVEISSSTAAPR